MALASPVALAAFVKVERRIEHPLIPLQYFRRRNFVAPLTVQAFTNFATGAALAGMRPVIEFQIPSLLFLVFEQIANQIVPRYRGGGRGQARRSRTAACSRS